MNIRVPTGSVSISFKPSPCFYLFILHSLVSAGPTCINPFFNHNSLSFLGTMMTDELQELNKHSSPKFSLKTKQLFCGASLSAAILAQRCETWFQILLLRSTSCTKLSIIKFVRQKKEKKTILNDISLTSCFFIWCRHLIGSLSSRIPPRPKR